MSIVFPGVAEVMASPLRPVSILMRLDFPTLERPIKAYSGNIPGGAFFHICITNDEFSACNLHFYVKFRKFLTLFLFFCVCKGSTYFRISHNFFMLA